MTSHLLSIIVFLPLVGALLVLLVPNRNEQGQGAAMGRPAGPGRLVLGLLLPLPPLVEFRRRPRRLQFVRPDAMNPAFRNRLPPGRGRNKPAVGSPNGVPAADSVAVVVG